MDNLVFIINDFSLHIKKRKSKHRPLPLEAISLLWWCVYWRDWENLSLTCIITATANHNHPINSLWTKSSPTFFFSCSKSHNFTCTGF